MWVFEGRWVICAKYLFLYSFDVLIKIFANSLPCCLKSTNTGKKDRPCQGHIQRLFGHSGFYWQSDKT